MVAPSPTIAAPSCDECGGTTKVLTLCQKCWFDADQENIRADNAYIATIAAPSPSHEVTPEMLVAFWEVWKAEQDIFGQPDDAKLLAIADGLEAALKARKPADDGAGQ
jgi:hypothetical protein